jgi:hypothetical protein
MCARAAGSIQSRNQPAGAEGARACTFSGLASALARSAAVIAPVSTMASSTRRARSAERSGWTAGS